MTAALAGAQGVAGCSLTGEIPVEQSQLDAYQSRITYLQQEANLDGFALNPDSQSDFWQFVRSEPGLRQGDLVLPDNGNLRAIWDDDGESHLGLQFLGGGIVQYVIFRQRESGGPISRVAGRDSLPAIKQQLASFQLNSLLSE